MLLNISIGPIEAKFYWLTHPAEAVVSDHSWPLHRLEAHLPVLQDLSPALRQMGSSETSGGHSGTAAEGMESPEIYIYIYIIPSSKGV